MLGRALEWGCPLNWGQISLSMLEEGTHATALCRDCGGSGSTDSGLVDPGKILGVKECCCCRTGAGVRKQKMSPSLTSAGSSQSRLHPPLLGS